MNDDTECINKINKYLQNWVHLDNEIKKNNIISGELYAKKRETESKIDKYYSKINNKKTKSSFQISDTKMQISLRSVNKPISLQHLKKTVNDYFNTTRIINKESLYNYFLKNRENYDKLIIKKVN